MYEIMQKNARKNERSSNKQDQQPDNITFDYDGKIMQIVKPSETDMPETLTNPRVKFKQPVVKSNFMKEQLDKLIKMKEDKNAAKSIKLKSVDLGEEL